MALPCGWSLSLPDPRTRSSRRSHFDDDLLPPLGVDSSYLAPSFYRHEVDYPREGG